MATLVFNWVIHFNFTSETTKQNLTKLKRRYNLNILYSVCVFGSDLIPRWPPWPLLCWGIFDFSETAKPNSTKLYMKQRFKVLFTVCVFGPIGKPKLPPWPVIWLDIFDFFSETIERNSTKLPLDPLPSLYFSGRSGNKIGRHTFWLGETFSTSALQPLNRICLNLTGSKISTSSTKFVFMGRSENQDSHPTSDWLSHFWILLYNRWFELKETWQGASIQYSISST